MKKIQITEITAAVLFLVLGISLILIPQISATAMYWLLSTFLLVSTMAMLARAVLQRSGMYFLIALTAAVFLALLILMPGVLASLAFAFFMLFCSFCYLIQAIADVREKSLNPANWMFAALYLLLAIFLILRRNSDSRILQVIVGWYLIFQAVQLLMVHGMTRHPHSWGYRLISHMTALPVSVATFLPFFVLEILDRRQKHDGNTEYDQNRGACTPDLTVYIHTGTEGAHIVGHMTFCFEGLMYSYGNYDRNHEKMHGVLGNAVFFTVPPEIYVNNSCIYEGSVLYAFGMILTEEQKTALRKELNSLMKSMIPWKCPLQADPDGWRHFDRYKNDYASRLYWRTGARFRQFTEGQWKTYWVMGSNCSLFAERVLTAAGLPIPRKQGIVSPGEYFQYFEELFADPSSQVISRAWHTASIPSTLYPTWA